MLNITIELDGSDLEKLSSGAPLNYYLNIRGKDNQIIIKTTPNAISNFKSFIYRSASISHEEIRDDTANMLKRKLILNPKSITDIETLGQILRDEE